MKKEITLSAAKKLLKKRAPSSHKGENGKLLIIGGSAEYHGAPILAGIGALRAGVDLVYLYVPECNFDITRAACPDFIVRKYTSEYFSPRAASEIIEFGKTCDAVLVGPGIGSRESVIEGTLEILKNLRLPTVLDASAMFALKKIKKFPLEQDILITPHRNEFTNLVDRDIDVKESDPKSMVLLRSLAMDLHLNIILKGQVDLVVSDEGDIVKNLTGNSGMTVGGTGDVLAGVAGGLIAQKNSTFVSAQIAAFLTGTSGDEAFKEYGNGLTASDVANGVGRTLQKIS